MFFITNWSRNSLSPFSLFDFDTSGQVSRWVSPSQVFNRWRHRRESCLIGCLDYELVSISLRACLTCRWRWFEYDDDERWKDTDGGRESWEPMRFERSLFFDLAWNFLLCPQNKIKKVSNKSERGRDLNDWPYPLVDFLFIIFHVMENKH